MQVQWTQIVSNHIHTKLELIQHCFFLLSSTFNSILFALQVHPHYQDQKERPLSQKLLPKQLPQEIDLKQLPLPQPPLKQ